MSWTTAILVVLLAAVLSVLTYLVVQRLDDRSPGGGTTTPRTSVVADPSLSLAGSDLGGSIHHRSGNQP